MSSEEHRELLGSRRAAVSLAGLAGDLDSVRRALGDSEAVVRSAAISSLARAGALSAAETAAAVLDPDPLVRRRLCELGVPIASDDLAALLRDTDPFVVEAAAFACGEQEEVGCVGQLSDIASGHSDPLCRESAVAALGVLGLEESLPVLLAATEDVAAIRRRAVIALVNFEGSGVTEALERALSDRDWQVRQAAEDVLGVNRSSDH